MFLTPITFPKQLVLLSYTTPLYFTNGCMAISSVEVERESKNPVFLKNSSPPLLGLHSNKDIKVLKI